MSLPAMTGPWHCPVHPDELDYSEAEQAAEQSDWEAEMEAHMRPGDEDDLPDALSGGGEAVHVGPSEQAHDELNQALTRERLRSSMLLEALKGVTRICEAVRYSAGLGKNQLARLEAARQAIALAEADND